jgi:hypothetical protein
LRIEKINQLNFSIKEYLIKNLAISTYNALNKKSMTTCVEHDKNNCEICKND